MDFLQAMQTRYTTKTYDSSKKISEEDLTALQEIVRLSPSSINGQPWKFTFVTDQEIKNQLAAVSFFNRSRIENCHVLVVFNRVQDLDKYEALIQSSMPEATWDYYKEFIKPLPTEKIYSWFEKQVYIALGILLSACANMKIDSTPMEGIEPTRYNEILQQKDYHSLMAVALGYRDPDDPNQLSKKPKTRLDMDQICSLV